MQEQRRPLALPEEALNMELDGRVAYARYVKSQDMSSVTIRVIYGNKEYSIHKNFWAARGNTYRRPDMPFVKICSADGLDYDTFARSVPERLELAHRKITVRVIVRKMDNGNYWPEVTSYTVSEDGAERSREQILEDATLRLNMKIGELEDSICKLADTQQKAESETRKLRKAYEELSMEYRMVVMERDRLRQQLGMEPVKSMLPENILDISGKLPNFRRGKREEELVQGDEILQAFLEGQI
jgi:hypothetical protein